MTQIIISPITATSTGHPGKSQINTRYRSAQIVKKRKKLNSGLTKPYTSVFIFTTDRARLVVNIADGVSLTIYTQQHGHS